MSWVSQSRCETDHLQRCLNGCGRKQHLFERLFLESPDL